MDILVLFLAEHTQKMEKDPVLCVFLWGMYDAFPKPFSLTLITQVETAQATPVPHLRQDSGTMITLHCLCLTKPHTAPYSGPFSSKFSSKPLSLPPPPILQRQPDPLLSLESETCNRLMS